MAKPKLHITDDRMLRVMDYCIAHKLKNTTSMKLWCEAIGMSPNNIYNVRNGLQQFTKDHIYAACKHFNISADYIYGFTTTMPRDTKKQSPLQKIKEALRELEAAKR